MKEIKEPSAFSLLTFPMGVQRVFWYRKSTIFQGTAVFPGRLGPGNYAQELGQQRKTP